jgi:hypothetical protein
MPLDLTLQKVEEDIAAGDLGIARDRLHGLIATYPDRLDLRPILGEVYWQLEYPSMAGRYWYLVEKPQPHMKQALARFEASCGQDSREILLALKIRVDPESLSDSYARRRLKALQTLVEDKHGQKLDFTRRGRQRYQPTARLERERLLFKWGCAAVLVLAAGLMILGIMSIVGRLF